MCGLGGVEGGIAPGVPTDGIVGGIDEIAGGLGDEGVGGGGRVEGGGGLVTRGGGAAGVVCNVGDECGRGGGGRFGWTGAEGSGAAVGAVEGIGC